MATMTNNNNNSRLPITTTTQRSSNPATDYAGPVERSNSGRREGQRRALRDQRACCMSRRWRRPAPRMVSRSLCCSIRPSTTSRTARDDRRDPGTQRCSEVCKDRRCDTKPSARRDIHVTATDRHADATPPMPTLPAISDHTTAPPKEPRGRRQLPRRAPRCRSPWPPA